MLMAVRSFPSAVEDGPFRENVQGHQVKCATMFWKAVLHYIAPVNKSHSDTRWRGLLSLYDYIMVLKSTY